VAGKSRRIALGSPVKAPARPFWPICSSMRLIDGLLMTETRCPRGEPRPAGHRVTLRRLIGY
jgi:hypothetical protein